MGSLGTPQGSNFKYISLRTKVGPEQKPYFVVQGKIDGKWQGVENHTEIVGKLIDIEFDVYEYNNDKIPQVKFYFDLGEGQPIHQVEANMSILSRSMINTFLGSLDHLNDEICVRLYQNKDGYASVYMARADGKGENDGRLGWAYAVGAFPGIDKAQVGGKTVIDDTAVNQFFGKAALQYLKPRLPGKPETKQVAEPFPPNQAPQPSMGAQAQAPPPQSAPSPFPPPSQVPTMPPKQANPAQPAVAYAQPPVKLPADDGDDLPF